MTIKNILPYGIVNYLSPYFNLRLLGFPKWQALKISLASKTAQYLRFTRLSLLPRDSFKELNYIVDVGANRGDWSLGILSLITPKKLIAIEPSQELNPILKSRLANYPNVTIFNVAVGDSPGNATFNITSHSHNSSLLAPKTEIMNEFSGDTSWDTKKQVDVPIETLDNLLSDLPEISLLKIDVQGYEKKVLEGSKETLKKTKFILLEVLFVSMYEGDTLFAELNEIMEDLGFSMIELKPCTLRNSLKITWGDAVYVAKHLINT